MADVKCQTTEMSNDKSLTHTRFERDRLKAFENLG